jgi:3-methyladenine DNA glycosylase AlkD
MSARKARSSTSEDADAVKRTLVTHADPAKAAILKGFFKTGKGQYGEGDIFLGVNVPTQRAVARTFKDLPSSEITTLVKSPVHEHRLTGLLILVEQYGKADDDGRRRILKGYLSYLSAGRVNNWDLIDLTAHEILGEELRRQGKGIQLLERLARSTNLWERRAAIVATFAFTRRGSDEECYAIATLLLADKHDLLQKANGWMLREAGKRVSEERLKAFLKKHVHQMSRTTLRYAIERFPESERKRFLFNT